MKWQLGEWQKWHLFGCSYGLAHALMSPHRYKSSLMHFTHSSHNAGRAQELKQIQTAKVVVRVKGSEMIASFGVTFCLPLTYNADASSAVLCILSLTFPVLCLYLMTTSVRCRIINNTHS